MCNVDEIKRRPKNQDDIKSVMSASKTVILMNVISDFSRIHHSGIRHYFISKAKSPYISNKEVFYENTRQMITLGRSLLNVRK
jgi:hypothetical protein